MPNLGYLLCGTTIAGMIAGRGMLQLGNYWEGRRGPHAFEGSMANWMMLNLFCLATVVFSVLALAVVWLNRLFLDPKPGQRALWEALGSTALIAAAGGLCFANLRPGNHYFLEGFKSFIEDHADLPAIKRWSRNLMLQDGFVPNENWPKFVSDLSPQSANVWTQAGNRVVLINWGGGFMHWGLAFRDPLGAPAKPDGCLVLEIDDESFVWVDAD